MKLVVATDGSAHAIRAASLTARLTRELSKSEVLLITVGHVSTLAMGGVAGDMIVDLKIIEQGLAEAARAILDQTRREFDGTGVAVATAYRKGDPATEIVKTAQEAGRT